MYRFLKGEWQNFRRDYQVKAYEESFKMDGVTDPLRFVKFSKKKPEGKYSQNNIMQLFVHRRLASQAVKKMPEKELIWLIEKNMYT